MLVQIFVRDRTETDYGHLSNLDFEHAGCGMMKAHTDVMSQDYELTCGCGQVVHLLRGGEAAEIVAKTGMGAGPAGLPEGNVYVMPRG